MPESKLNIFKRSRFFRLFLGPVEVSDENLDAYLEFLNDRMKFHIWLTSLISGSVVIIITLGIRPGVGDYRGITALLGFLSLLISIITNLTCIWTIPIYKLRIKTGVLRDSLPIRLDLGIAAWIGVITFFAGILLIGLDATMP